MCTSTFSRLNSLVSSLHASPTEFNLHNIKIYTHSFKIYGIWPQASKQAYTRTHVQCSHASVGLAQARPKHYFYHRKSLLQTWKSRLVQCYEVKIWNMKCLLGTKPCIG